MILSPNGTHAITAVSGNKNTGLRDSTDVSTRRPRRAAGIRIVRTNAQVEMVQLLGEEERGDPMPLLAGMPIWFLLYFRERDVVRSELSLARRVTKTGTLIDWTERLVLPEISMLDGPIGGDRIAESEDVEVPVERRAS